jgi:hypothetical protein
VRADTLSGHPDGLSEYKAADTLSLYRECPSACPSAGGRGKQVCHGLDWEKGMIKSLWFGERAGGWPLGEPG